VRPLPSDSTSGLTPSERAAVLDRIDELLELTYRSSSLGNLDDPLDEAIYILLSRQTRQPEYQKVYRALRERWPTWHGVLAAAPRDISRVIGPAGFGPTRARQIKDLLRAVAQACEERGLSGCLTLDWLHSLDDAAVEAFLIKLPGIGPKSARCIMLYSLGRDAFAVDTHIRRILDKLGIVADSGGKVDHRNYESVVPTRMRRRLHVNLIHHGRAVCQADRPRCDDCPLVSFCPEGRRRASRALSGRPVAVELFAGGGGLGEGFTRAGFRVAAAIELDRHAAQTYRVNHPGTVVIEANAMRFAGNRLLRLVPAAARADVIIAGPPCQGYSAAGRRRASDGKNRLYRAVIRLANELKPRFVVMENVPGMRRVEGHSFVEVVKRALESTGYAVDEHLLRACDFGVPQMRKRLVFLAQRRCFGEAPLPPEPTHCARHECPAGCGSRAGSKCGKPATPTVLDALDGLPALDLGQHAEFVPLDAGVVLVNGSTMRHSPKVVAKIRALHPGEGPISYRRLHPDLARTVVAGHRALPVHPSLDRTVSVREAARIQGFADSHVFAGPRSAQPLQVANAVPPPLAEAVARSIVGSLSSAEPSAAR
jgi:DNA (cytosine-5)-methyltransferase 1